MAHNHQARVVSSEGGCRTDEPKTIALSEKRSSADGSLSSSLLSPSHPPIDPEAERRLLRKIDLHVYPILFVIYMLSFLDRINISNARIQGLTEDLNMEGNDFNIALFVRPNTTQSTVNLLIADCIARRSTLFHT